MTNHPILHKSVLDSLEEQIAVIDNKGSIIYVNFAWVKFGSENGGAPIDSWVGINYLEICNSSYADGDSLAGKIMKGIHDVLTDKTVSFYFEYPCNSPGEKRWFLMRATRLQSDLCDHIVLSRHNITIRKLAEEKAKHLSLHDPLTGLANRRHFDLLLDREWRRGMRNKLPVSLIMFDIDYFKKYNDKFVHLGGDQCLVKVSHELKRFSRRPGDLAARYGGEEFVLLLGDTDLKHSIRIAEITRKSIYDLNIVYDDTSQVTISAGVASIIPYVGQENSFLVKDADKALYCAKKAGRNCIST